MEFEDRLQRINELTKQREQITSELCQLLNLTEVPTKKQIKCKTCGEVGHNAKTCPQKSTPAS